MGHFLLLNMVCFNFLSLVSEYFCQHVGGGAIIREEAFITEIMLCFLYRFSVLCVFSDILGSYVFSCDNMLKSSLKTCS